MFDGLLKSKFYCKCKADAKMVKTRVEIIRNKRNAMQKYLRNDVADLLKNRLDINAYGRAEGLVVELNRTECYEYIEQCAVQVMNSLGVLNRQRECPEECNEAVSSLMFAAARFADLPELRELRTIFSERYGNSLDFYVNKQFVEKLKSGLPSKDKKLQLLQDIAHESGIEWNSKALENKLYNEATCNEEIVKENNNPEYTLPVCGSVHENDSNGTEYQFKKARESNAPERRLSHYEEKEDYRLPKEPPQVLPLRDIQIDTIRKTEKQNQPIPPKEKQQEDKPLHSIPPPYTKSEANKPKSSSSDKTNDSCVKMAQPMEKTRPVPKSVRRNLRPPQFQENAGSSKGDERERVTDKNKEKAAQGQRILKFFDGGGSDQKDEEDIMMDKLLRHYSRKKGPNENVKPDSLLKEPAIKGRSKDGPNRSSSLPGELTSPTETPKGHTRAASFQAEMINGNNVHVHPKLPDYDDFLARLETLRRKS